jgi:DNA-binding CsgD family transcriptional regulator
LLAQGGSNQEISGQLNLSPRTVRQHLRTLFLRAGIRKEIQISLLVGEGLTNREIGKIIGPAEPVIKSHLCSAFDKLSVWSRLELAM